MASKLTLFAAAAATGLVLAAGGAEARTIVEAAFRAAGL